jgi:hypothetical protein
MFDWLVELIIGSFVGIGWRFALSVTIAILVGFVIHFTISWSTGGFVAYLVFCLVAVLIGCIWEGSAKGDDF